ncbi:hypothetical protein IMCC20628_04300 [Hoeflea sp. IMCC20628]|uniref:COG4223 family protein n=1 Tax=Hoeflea sp. IMCC20628 TaxID=1620421 RepID=UPI00063BDDF0|nr:mitofilin family membrane protein [Hoeflea sp. IMCC20628]AKI02976.1 hypothetical protein IMCC20628_04300 [Hoeflea sp. IMCC20628]
MNKGPTPRHSKSPKPVVIDLDATDVTPKDADLSSKPAASAASAPKPGPAKSTPVVSKTDDGKTSAKPDATVTADKLKTDSTAKPGGETKTAGAAAASATPDPKPKHPENKTSAAGQKPAAAGKRGGGLGMVVSGVIGAVIALGGGYALQSGGLLPVPGGNNDQVQALSSKVEALSTTVGSLATQVTDSTNAGETDISAQLSARLTGLETSVKELAEGSTDAADPAAVEALQTRLSAIETEIASLDQADGNAATAAADPAVAEAVSELQAAQSGLQASLADIQTVTETLSGKIATIEQGQAELSQQLGEPGRQIDLARAISAAGLKSAIDRGGSFMSELEAFASVVPDDPAVPELRDLAARGVPSRSKLIEGFPDAASKAIAAAEPVDPNSGLVDRLMSSALSVVKVRKVGDVEGDSAEAIAARAEARLLDGDLYAALAEWNTLPESSRLAASDYGNALAARARAEMLIAASMAPVGSPSPSETPAN